MIICVTGYYGSGKSTAARMLGLRVISADRLGREAFSERKKEIKNLFGTLDKNKIKEMIFSDVGLLNRFNRIVHPLLIRKLNNVIHKNKNRNLIIDAALYYNLKLDKLCNKVILVKRDKEKIIKTLKEQKEDVERIISKQKIPKKADFVINNNGTKDELKLKARHIKNKLLIQKDF
jgi:dephospho-CoA kinase